MSAILQAKVFLKSVEFTRPANTTQYAANSVVANSTSAATVLSVDVGGGSGYINKIRFETNDSTDTSAYRLHLYHTLPTAINDGAAMPILWANRSKRIGKIALDSLITGAAGSDAAVTDITTPPFSFVLPSGSTTIYIIVETLTQRTPGSGKAFYIELGGSIE